MRAIAWMGFCATCIAGCGTDAGVAIVRLAEAQRLHEAAARLAAGGDIEGSVRALESFAALSFPAGAPEAEDVAVDALAEASRVLLAAGRSAEAAVLAHRAIARATRSSYFLGLAYLRLGDALRAAGRAREAVDALERSIETNRAAMAAALAEEGW